MPSNQLVINKVKELYLKHRGENHRKIEQEMHALGCRRFSRRSLYNQKTKTGHSLGWIEKYGWKTLLIQSENIPHRTVDTPDPMSPPSGEDQPAQSSASD